MAKSEMLMLTDSYLHDHLGTPGLAHPSTYATLEHAPATRRPLITMCNLTL